MFIAAHTDSIAAAAAAYLPACLLLLPCYCMLLLHAATSCCLLLLMLACCLLLLSHNLNNIHPLVLIGGACQNRSLPTFCLRVIPPHQGGGGVCGL